MSKSASGTISASNTTIGPVEVGPGEVVVYTVDYTSGTITLQYATAKAGPFIALEDGYTADTAKQGNGPGWYQLVGSSTPSAAVSMVVR
jgi:hypothetical protein